MPDLTTETLLDGARIAHGGAALTEAARTPLHWLAPFPSREAAFGATLEAAHGLAWPAPGKVTRAEGMEARWAGRAQALLVGVAEPASALAAEGAVTDVSDVYVRLLLSGEARAEVLARLVPLDLRADRFGAGATARTLLGHIAAHLTAREDWIEIAVMRSFGASAVHEIERAMCGVAARQALAD